MSNWHGSSLDCHNDLLTILDLALYSSIQRVSCCFFAAITEALEKLTNTVAYHSTTTPNVGRQHRPPLVKLHSGLRLYKFCHRLPCVMHDAEAINLVICRCDMRIAPYISTWRLRHWQRLVTFIPCLDCWLSHGHRLL